MSARWDVIVVGGRVAGAATALPLARAGLRVLVVDRARQGSDTLSTHAFMRAGVLQLGRLGVLDAITAAGTPPVRRTTFVYGEDTVRVSVHPSPGVDALYAPRRTVLDTVLGEAATAAGATLRYRTTVPALLRGPDGRVRGVRTRTPDGRERTEHAGLVIGADGRSSTVAQQVAAPVRYAGRSAAEVLYGYWSELPVDGYTWCYTPGSSAGAVPTNGGLTCVFAAGRPAEVGRLVRELGPEGALRALTATGPLGPALSVALRRGGIRHIRGVPGQLRVPYGPGWALVGDAGCWMDPLSTHGMTAALRDADLLARAVLTAPSPGRARTAALAEYAQVRDALSLPMLRVTERIAAHDWDLGELRDLLRQLSSTMVDEVELLQALPEAA